MQQLEASAIKELDIWGSKSRLEVTFNCQKLYYATS